MKNTAPRAGRARRVRTLAALLLVLSVTLTGCGFLDAVEKAVKELIAGGIAFDSQGNVDVAGVRVNDFGRAVERYDQNKKNLDTTDENIAAFIRNRDSGAVGDVTGPTDQGGALDKQLDKKFGGGPPEGTPNRQNYPALNAGEPNSKIIWTQYPTEVGQKLPANGVTQVQYSTWVAAGVKPGAGTNPQLAKVGAALTITTKDGKVTNVSLTPRVNTIDSKADILQGTSFAGILVKAEGVAPTPPKDDKNGNWTGGQVRADISSQLQVFGINPYTRTLIVEFNVIDNVVYFTATAPSEVKPAPTGFLEEAFDAFGRALSACSDANAPLCVP